MIILLAVLALVVVKALADSPWGAFTVFATLPIAVFMGVYGRYLRPGRIGEMSLIGFVLLLASIALRPHVSRKRDARAALHLQGRDAGLHADRLWLRRLGAAGVAAARAARLSLDLPEDRHDPVARDRHFHRLARSANAGDQPLHRRHGPGVRRQPVSRSCSSPSPAARCRAFTRWSPPARRRR